MGQAEGVEFTSVCDDDLVVDQVRLVQVGDERIALVRLADGYYALSDTCSHMGGFLSDGCIEDGQIVCVWHNGWFDVRTGQATVYPAREPVFRYAVKVEAGRVLVSARPVAG